MPHPRTDISALDVSELEATLTGRGIAAFHARQLYRWIYKRGVTDVEKMTASRPFLLACFRTTSVPCTFVSIVRTGDSTISLTPTAAAR